MENACTKEELTFLTEISQRQPMHPVLLPIKSVGVQGDKRTYSYVLGLSPVDGKVSFVISFYAEGDFFQLFIPT